MNITQLETPCLILDREKLINNIEKLHQRMKYLGVNLRPHGKTAKNIDVLSLAMAGQSGGITVSTLKEAEYYFQHGVKDIVYAVGIAPNKLARVVRLIKKGAEITLLLDTMAQAHFVAQQAIKAGVTIPVLIEIDCDGHRSGIGSNDPMLLELGELIHQQEGILLQGVLTHAGESYSCKSTDDIRVLAHVERDEALKCATLLRHAGLSCDTVSVGSTPTAMFAEDLSGITEVRAGVFMFFDLVMAGLGVCKIDDIAVSVLTSVIGHQKSKNWVITDAGWMGLSRDRGTLSQKVDQGYGVVCSVSGNVIDDLLVTGVNQEHGIISPRDSDKGEKIELALGEMVRILPNHACATAAMYDKYYVVDKSGNVIDEWSRVNGW